jgi:N-acetylglucosamine transport system permease protein
VAKAGFPQKIRLWPIAKRGATMKHGEKRFIFGFLFIPLLLYTVFVVLPYTSAILIAFTRWRGVSANITFNGLNNFARLAQDDLFLNALKNNAKVLITLPTITIALALLFAALFTRGLRGQRFFRTTFFFPQVLSMAVVGVLFNFVYHPTLGILSNTFKALGIKELSTFPWLGDVVTVLPAIVFVAIWQATGFYMVLFMASMGSIPTEFYEAAKIDGAGEWAIFWKITLPLLRESLRTAVVFLMIMAMDMFVYVSFLTNETGGPGRAAQVLSSYLYQTAFRQGNFGYGTTLAVVLMMVVLVLSIIGLRAGSQETVEF